MSFTADGMPRVTQLCTRCVPDLAVNLSFFETAAGPPSALISAASAAIRSASMSFEGFMRPRLHTMFNNESTWRDSTSCLVRQDAGMVRKSAADQHATMKRVYDAAKRHDIIKGMNSLTELTDKLELDSAQRVKNWDARGPSAEALLLIQQKTGINATWAQTGEGPEMLAGWPRGRKEKPADSLAAQVSTPDEVQSILKELAQLIGKVPSGPGRHRLAEQLSALALAPDSGTLVASIAADLTGGLSQPPASLTVDARELRMQAWRFAEANEDSRAKALLIDFLGMLDRIVREPPTPPTSAGRRAKSRGKPA